MSKIYPQFTGHLRKNAYILDAGCGSGRDSLYFLKNGFQVDAFDASAKMVEHAKKLTGLEVLKQKFEETQVSNKYDGIWACASLLHVPSAKLPSVMNKLIKALKPDGVIYLSFKYGGCERFSDGRHFTDMNETSFKKLITCIDRINFVSMWVSEDNRPDRTEKWFNAILKKI